MAELVDQRLQQLRERRALRIGRRAFAGHGWLIRAFICAGFMFRPGSAGDYLGFLPDSARALLAYKSP
jgi:hypothetical protein